MSHFHFYVRNFIVIGFIFIIGIHRFIPALGIPAHVHPFQVDAGGIVIKCVRVYGNMESVRQLCGAGIVIPHPDAIGFALVGKSGGDVFRIHLRHIVGSFSGRSGNIHHRWFCAVFYIEIIRHHLPRFVYRHWLSRCSRLGLGHACP